MISDRDLLEFAHRKVLDEGGDGWGLVISRRYRELAAIYETIDGHFLDKEERNGMIHFSGNQEFVTFCGDIGSSLELSGYEFVVILE